jgi:asparagine synthase (glutamine-hydrolysing)
VCGIAGFLSRTDAPADRGALQAMVDAVAHRGPDGDGTFYEGKVGLGSRRLAIIDLSENGAMPMRCAASGRVIVHNGEIYNYVELRAELAKEGYQFRTATDTEVILAAYDRWGEACVQRFNGMWAFALYDPANDIVFCSRDRFGVKPFYFADEPHFFAFGSEIRQLLPLLNARQACRTVLLDALVFSSTDTSNETFFAGVTRLAAAHNLRYYVSTGNFETYRYYKVLRSDKFKGLSETEASDALRDLLTDAVRLRLRSDVPVGTCLSGGLDSSSVASIAASLIRDTGGAHRFSAITAVSEDSANDESEFAKAVVDAADLKWHPIRPSFEEFRSTLPDVIRAQEEPFTTPSMCMQFLVMREAKRQGLTVLLDGQGGDETLLGYERYSVSVVREAYDQSGMRAAIGAMRDLAKNNSKLGLAQQLMFLGYFSSPRLRWLNYRRRMNGVHCFPTLAHYRNLTANTAVDVFDAQRREIEHDVIPGLLRYEDRNSMWHSVETRLPFLDYRVVEFGLNLSASMKLKNGWMKYPLRRAMSALLPDAVAWRKRKVGFEAPDGHWLPRLRATMLESVQRSELLRELFAMKSEPLRVQHLALPKLWQLYVAALWANEFSVSSLSPDLGS